MTPTAIEIQDNSHGHFAIGGAQRGRVFKAQDLSR